MWLLLASHDLEDRRPVVLFGVTCGFGLLLKVSFPLFVALPFAHALWRSRHRAQALLTAAVPCLLLALPWYLVNGRPHSERHRSRVWRVGNRAESRCTRV